MGEEQIAMTRIMAAASGSTLLPTYLPTSLVCNGAGGSASELPLT